MTKEAIERGERVLANIEIKEFPTHLAYTNNKVAPNKYVKINSQTIYNGKISRFSRNILMANMHKTIMPYLQNINITEFPVKVNLELSTVINHGDVQRRLDKKTGEYRIIWKEADDDYKPSADIDNISWVWIKAFNDSLNKANCIPDDNIQYISGYSVSFTKVDSFDDRSLNFKIVKNE